MELLYGPGKEALMPAVRWAAEMEEVLYRGETAGEEGAGKEGDGEGWQRILYFMYRDFNLPEHLLLFRENGIRYDITVLIPGNIGMEYIKTAGHYHPLKPGAACTYPEVYEVLHGRAFYLIQRAHCLEESQKGLADVIVFDAAPGDKVLIPPDFGHVTINPGPDFLIMSNLVAADFESVYAPLQEMGGAGYFGLIPDDKRESGLWNGDVSFATGGEPVFKPNPHYSSLPPLLRARPLEVPQFSLRKEIPQYRAFIENPAHFSFLTRPEDFRDDFQEYLQGALIK